MRSVLFVCSVGADIINASASISFGPLSIYTVFNEVQYEHALLGISDMLLGNLISCNETHSEKTLFAIEFRLLGKFMLCKSVQL